MFRKALFAAVCLVFVGQGMPARAGSPGTATKIGALIELLPVVIKLFDRPGVERREVVVTPLTVEAKSKLVFATKTYKVQTKRSHEKWNGDIHVTVTVPVKVSFALDLANVGNSKATWNAAKKRLEVAAPPGDIDALEVCLEEMTSSVVRTGIRFGMFNGGLETELREGALREVRGEARRIAEADLYLLQALGRERLQSFLGGLLKTAPDVEVSIK